jgi:hypothetical protein
VREKMRTHPAYAGYVEETSAEFYIALPNTTTGACPGETQPVYRVWNQRVDSNHRYTTDRATRDAMIARGYRSEGYGALGVAMCTPQAGIGDSRVRVTGGARSATAATACRRPEPCMRAERSSRTSPSTRRIRCT